MNKAVLAAAARSHRRPENEPAMDVLIAEDDAFLRQTLVEALARRGRGLAMSGDGLDELSARLRALVRCATMQPAAVHRGWLRVERDSGAFYVGTRIPGVTTREQTFPSALIVCAGRVVPEDRLLLEVFPFDTQAPAQALDAGAHRVCRRLGGAGVALVPVRGLGCILQAGPLRMFPPGHASRAGEVVSGRTPG